MANKAALPIRMAGENRLGNKQVFLPNFVLTLLNTPDQSPNFASFIVPLNINKLDLRDYLFNAYGVRVRGVRSYIQQQKVQQDKPGAIRIAPRKWYRPRSIKKMLVELEQPFVWPEAPENYDPWDKAAYDEAKKSQEEQNETVQPDFRQKPSRERKSIAEQAKALLNAKRETRVMAKAGWKPNNPKREEWEDVGEAVEVEQEYGIENADQVAQQKKEAK